jgi:hypothetical protein
MSQYSNPDAVTPNLDVEIDQSVCRRSECDCFIDMSSSLYSNLAC